MIKRSISILCIVSLIFSQLIITSVDAKQDRTAPVIVNSMPINNQANVERNVSIMTKFNENIYKGSNFSKIKLTASNKPLTIRPKISKNRLNINHVYFLKYNTKYVLTIPARSIKDKAGNFFKKIVTIKFKTKMKPIATATPVHTPTSTMTPSQTNTPTATATPVSSSDLPQLNWNSEYLSVKTTDLSKAGYAIQTDQVTELPAITTGIQKIYFDVIPMENNIEASVDFAGGNTNVIGFENFAISIKFSNQGTIEAIDGLQNDEFISNQAIPYSANKKYHFELTADMNAKTYSVWFTVETQQGIMKFSIAHNFGFRSTALDTDNLGEVYFTSKNGNDMKVQYLSRGSDYIHGALYSSIYMNGGWEEYGLAFESDQSKRLFKVNINMDITPTSPFCNSSVYCTDGLFLEQTVNLVTLIRLNDSGTFDLGNFRDGNPQELSNLAYEANKKYHIRIEARLVDIDYIIDTYSVWVTPEGEEEIQIAHDYKIRPLISEFIFDINKIYVVSAEGNDRLRMENLTVEKVYTMLFHTPIPTLN